MTTRADMVAAVLEAAERYQAMADGNGTFPAMKVHYADKAAALRAAAEALAAEEWRPIETAPLAEDVLLWTTGEWVGQARLDFWDPANPHENPSWRWSSFSMTPGDPVHPNFTPMGWRPLPAPPAEGG